MYLYTCFHLLADSLCFFFLSSSRVLAYRELNTESNSNCGPEEILLFSLFKNEDSFYLISFLHRAENDSRKVRKMR